MRTSYSPSNLMTDKVAEFRRRNVNGFDYTNQAWVVNGKYQRCGHPENMVCGCYGREHAGRPVSDNADVH